MKNKILFLLFITVFGSLVAQEDKRTILRGTVLYQDVLVVGENVINVNSKKATITNNDGQFAIRVQVGDTLVFTALNYQFKSISITDQILKNQRLVVEVKEKVTELDEVVISPERQARFLALEKEKFEQYDYDQDKQTKLRNEIVTQGQLTNGVNFVNIFKAIAGTKKDKAKSTSDLKMSSVLRQIYEDEFFVADLGVAQEDIDKFLFFCDDKVNTRSLLNQDNQFQLIDFLVTQSMEFRKL